MNRRDRENLPYALVFLILAGIGIALILTACLPDLTPPPHPADITITYDQPADTTNAITHTDRTERTA